MPELSVVNADHPRPSAADLWEQDRALLEEYGASHVDSICAVAAGLRADGDVEQAAELDRQCARMAIILMDDHELRVLYQRKEGEAGSELADLLGYEIKWRGLDI